MTVRKAKPKPRKSWLVVNLEAQLKITSEQVVKLEGMVQALELRNTSFEQENDHLRAVVLSAMRSMAPAAALASSYRSPRTGVDR